MAAMTAMADEDRSLFQDAIEAAARAKCRDYCADDTGETWWRHAGDVRDMHRQDALRHVQAAMAAGADIFTEQDT